MAAVLIYFIPVFVNFVVSMFLLVFCRHKCVPENAAVAEAPNQVPTFVRPVGVPETVTSPYGLCAHYWAESMFTWLGKQPSGIFPAP